MIADLKPYEEYKESGLQWLGQVPEHWALPRLGSVLRERNETNENKQVMQVLSVLKDIGVIRYEDKGRIGNKKSEDIARYKIVRPDDIVVNCMNVIIGSVGLSRLFGCLSPVYYVLTRRREEDNPSYLSAVFSVKPFQESLVRIGNGILSHRMRIPMELLKCEPFPLPPPSEQATIVRFLNWANGRLDRAVRAKRKIIKLLEEQKQVIIQQAVTGGVNADGSMATDRTDYLSGRFIRKIEQGWSPVAGEGDFNDEAWAVVTLSSVKSGCFYPQANKPLPKKTVVPPSLEIEKGNFLLTRSNTRNLVGDVCIVEDTRPKLMLCDLIYRLTIDQTQIYPKFFMYQLLSRNGRNQIERDARGSSHTMVKLSHSHINKWRICIAPMSEQIEIVAYLDKICDQFSIAINRLEREIDLLREYRTRLFADVVTGKLDVRGVAAQLPDEIVADPDAEVCDDELIDAEEDVTALENEN